MTSPNISPDPIAIRERLADEQHQCVGQRGVPMIAPLWLWPAWLEGVAGGAGAGGRSGGPAICRVSSLSAAQHLRRVDTSRITLSVLQAAWASKHAL